MEAEHQEEEGAEAIVEEEDVDSGMVKMGAEGEGEDEAKLQTLTQFSSDQKEGAIATFSSTVKAIEKDE